MRRQLSRKSSPSGVRVIARVLRWNNRTPRWSSSSDMVFPTAEDETLRRRPASVKLRASAARTNTPKALRLSIGAPRFRRSVASTTNMYAHIVHVFDHIPMLRENATFDPDNIGGDPVSGKPVSGKTSVGDHVIALSNDQSLLVF